MVMRTPRGPPPSPTPPPRLGGAVSASARALEEGEWPLSTMELSSAPHPDSQCKLGMHGWNYGDTTTPHKAVLDESDTFEDHHALMASLVRAKASKADKAQQCKPYTSPGMLDKRALLMPNLRLPRSVSPARTPTTQRQHPAYSTTTSVHVSRTPPRARPSPPPTRTLATAVADPLELMPEPPPPSEPVNHFKSHLLASILQDFDNPRLFEKRDVAVTLWQGRRAKTPAESPRVDAERKQSSLHASTSTSTSTSTVGQLPLAPDTAAEPLPLTPFSLRLTAQHPMRSSPAKASPRAAPSSQADPDPDLEPSPPRAASTPPGGGPPPASPRARPSPRHQQSSPSMGLLPLVVSGAGPPQGSVQGPASPRTPRLGLPLTDLHTERVPVNSKLIQQLRAASPRNHVKEFRHERNLDVTSYAVMLQQIYHKACIMEPYDDNPVLKSGRKTEAASPYVSGDPKRAASVTCHIMRNMVHR